MGPDVIHHQALTASLLAAGLVAGCGGGGSVRSAPPDAAARVGPETIPYADFEDYVASSGGAETALSSEVLSGLFDQYVEEALLRSMAVEDGLVAPGAVGLEVVAALLAGSPEAAITVTDGDVSSYYTEHRDEFERPERVRLRQLLAESRELAEEVAARLRGGSTLTDLLAAHPQEALGGGEDEIAREDLPAAFVEKIFALEPGQVSEVIAADYGFHVFQVVERLPERTVSLAEASVEIAETLRAERSREALDRLVEKARERYNVEVYARNLPFNYEGQYESQTDPEEG